MISICVAFFNQGACFSTSPTSNSAVGDASFTTNNSGPVYGTLNRLPRRPTATLALTGELTGRSYGTPTSTGSLSDGLLVGKWTLDPGTSAPNCNASSGTFVMCQGAATCTIP